MKNIGLNLAAAFLLVAGLLSAPHALAQTADTEKTLEERREEARVERLWNLSWRQFAPMYLEHDGKFICVKNYSRRSPSSVGQSINDYRQESAFTQEYTDERGRNQARKLVKPEPEAFAAVALIPEVQPGQYGYIHSAKIHAIKDDRTLELQDIWLVDADAVGQEKSELKRQLWGEVIEDIEAAIRDRQRSRHGRASRRLAENEAIDWGFEAREDAIRRQRDRVFSRYTWVVQGYATGNLVEGARWPSEKANADGLQLIVVNVQGRTVTAVPAATLGRGLTELQFIDCLMQRNLNKAKFIDMVTEAKRQAREGYVDLVLAQLEGEQAPAGRGVNNEIELAQ